MYFHIEFILRKEPIEAEVYYMSFVVGGELCLQ